MLLLVDNCEHVVAASAHVFSTLLQACPGVRVLATSRERLGVIGEATYQVPPLGVPPHTVDLRADDALRYPAVNLFVERARSVNDSFVLTDANASTVAEICRRVDGIALAIELAAARTRSIDIDRIAALLDESFRFLTDGSRSALPHQQTLQATIDWSYELLGSAERTLFARLAVFSGGFTLDAIVRVCAGDALDGADIFGALSALVDKSLVNFDGAQRYRLLESTRAYARERLLASGDLDEAAVRHVAYVGAFVERVSLAEGSGPYRAWLLPLETEIDNIRAALEWSIGEGRDIVAGGAIVASLVETSSLGRWTEWASWSDRALTALPADAPRAARGRLLTRRAEFASNYGVFGGTEAAVTASTEAVKLLRGHPESKWFLEALNASATAYARAGDREKSLEAAREGRELAIATDDVVYQASFLRRIAALLVDDDPAEAVTMFKQSITLCVTSNNDFGLALSYHWLGQMHATLGEYDAAVEAVNSACTIRRQMGDVRGLAFALGDLSGYALLANRFDRLPALIREALEIVRTTENALGVAIVAQSGAELAFERGDDVAAASLAGFAQARYASLGIKRESTARMRSVRLLERLGERVGDAERDRLVLAGSKLTAAEAEAEVARYSEG